MSLPVINPDALPVLPTWARRAIYGTFVLAIVVVQAVDSFYGPSDPAWVAGAIRVLDDDTVALAVGAVALLNARPAAAERAQARSIGLESYTPEGPQPGRLLGHPEHLQTRPVTSRDADADDQPPMHPAT